MLLYKCLEQTFLLVHIPSANKYLLFFSHSVQQDILQPLRTLTPWTNWPLQFQNLGKNKPETTKKPLKILKYIYGECISCSLVDSLWSFAQWIHWTLWIMLHLFLQGWQPYESIKGLRGMLGLYLSIKQPSTTRRTVKSYAFSENLGNFSTKVPAVGNIITTSFLFQVPICQIHLDSDPLRTDYLHLVHENRMGADAKYYTGTKEGDKWATTIKGSYAGAGIH